jgi:hypothetical protein
MKGLWIAFLVVTGLCANARGDDDSWTFIVRQASVAANFATMARGRGETRDTRQPILKTSVLIMPNTNYILVTGRLIAPADRVFYTGLETAGALIRLSYTRLYHQNGQEKVERKNSTTSPEIFGNLPRDLYEVWVSCP